MTTRTTITGSVALMILMGTLLLGGAAHAVPACDAYQTGTQAYGECMVRAEDREAAPIVPPSQLQEESTTTVVRTTSADVWQLSGAGLIGALLAIGVTLAVTRLSHRQGVTAH